jgi:predicted RND superfamily exporter protein
LTLGATGLLYGRLNLYTMFVISILFGMGIDYSIYTIGYAQKLVMRGRTWAESLAETLSTLFFSLVVAMLTTAGGLLCLRASRFVGFYEFGVIGAAGIFISLLATFLLLPAWVFLFEDLGARFRVLRFLDVTPKHDYSMLPGVDRVKDWTGFTRKTAMACLGITAILVFFVPRGVRFEFDFANLREKPKKLTPAEEEYNRKHDFPVSHAIASNRRSSQPVVIVADRQETMDELHDTLMNRFTVEHDTLLRSFLTYRTFVPKAADQQARLPYLKQIDSLVGASVFDKAEGDDAEMIRRLRAMAKARSFGAEEIPPWALNLLRERDGSYGKIAFVYGNFESSNAKEADKFEKRYGSFRLKGGEEPRAFSSAFIYADIIRIVKEDSRWMFLLMVVVLLAMLHVILRSFLYAAIHGIEMAVGVIWTLGICGLLGYKINVFNIIAITTLQGVAVDVTTYVILAYLRLGRNRIGDIFKGIAGMMAAAELTTLAGYAGMLFVNNQGIASIGKFAVVGLASLLVTSLMLVPWLCAKLIPDSHIHTSDDVIG